MTLGKFFQFGLGFVVSAFFVWLTLRSIPFGDILAALGAVDLRWMALAFVFFAVGYTCRIERWRRMLAPHAPGLSWRRSAVPFMASIAANNLLPFRAGDALRSVAFSSWLGVPTARVLATLLAERLMDLLTLLLALSLAIAVLGSGNGLEALLGWSAWFFGAAVLLVALVVLLPRLFEPPVTLMLRGLERLAPKAAAALGAQVERVFDTLEVLASRGQVSTLLGLSVLAWGFEGCMFYAVARALPDLAQPVAALLAMPVGSLSTMIPSTPGYFGTFHYFAMHAMQSQDNSEAASAAFAFLVHFTLYVPVTVTGSICFCYWMHLRASGTQGLSQRNVGRDD